MFSMAESHGEAGQGGLVMYIQPTKMEERDSRGSQVASALYVLMEQEGMFYPPVWGPCLPDWNGRDINIVHSSCSQINHRHVRSMAAGFNPPR